MSRICLIGNYGKKTEGKDGQTAKVRVYLEALNKEGFDVDFVDTSLFKRKPFSVLFRIKKAISRSDRIVLITAKNGSKYLLPYINFINRRAKKPVVFPLIGTSVLHFEIDKLDDSEKIKFLCESDYLIHYKRPSFSKQLSKITYVLPETDLLTDVFARLYRLNNCCTLTNFRFYDNEKYIRNNETERFKIIYLSRLVEFKGIFDLIESVKDINNAGGNIYLDIYGDKYLTENENHYFESLLDDRISYKGSVENANVIKTISNYDLFAFPTRAPGEGTPGVVVESLLAGVPILTSDFPNAKCLMRDGYDSVFYKMFDKADLKLKLQNCIDDKNKIYSMRDNALKSGNRFTYDYSRDLFLKLVCGLGDK